MQVHIQTTFAMILIEDGHICVSINTVISL